MGAQRRERHMHELQRSLLLAVDPEASLPSVRRSLLREMLAPHDYDRGQEGASVQGLQAQVQERSAARQEREKLSTRLMEHFTKIYTQTFVPLF